MYPKRQNGYIDAYECAFLLRNWTEYSDLHSEKLRWYNYYNLLNVQIIVIIGAKMECEICGKSYDYSCRSCTKRVTTWGQDGLLYLMELAKKEGDIQSEDLVPIVETYYRGSSKTRRAKVNVLRTALRLLGYKGKFVGRIHKNGTTYKQIRKRELTSGRRWQLRNGACDNCGSTELLSLHHIVPLAWGGKTSMENCVTLCETCHRATHRRLSGLLTREKLLEYIAPYYSEIETLAKQSVTTV